jgi:ribose transport system permease protein
MTDIAHSVRPSFKPGIPGVGIVLLVLLAIFTLTANGFATAANVSNVLSQASILLLLAIPMTLIIMTEGLDLSMGAVLTLAAVALALVVTTTGSVPLALIASVAVGLSFGLLNGVIVAILAVPPFVTTLGVMGVAQGLALIVTDGQIVIGIPPSIRAAYAESLLGIPAPVFIAGLVYALMHLLLYRTRFGTCVFALGGNRDALKLAGLPVKPLLIAVYALGGVCAGLAAILMAARMNSGHPTAAIGMEFEAIVAVAIGGTAFARGKGTLSGTLIGVITVGVLRNGLNLLGVSSSLQVAAVGALVILSLLIDGFWSRKS